jgi:hypothetical protein
VPTSDWIPSVDQVGAQLRARTKDKTGTEVGTFTGTTRPTDVQVTDLIEQGVRDVARVVGEDLPPQTLEDAKDVAVLATAMRVELSYFPEQINSGRSPYPQLKQMFDDSIKALQIEVAKEESGDTTDPGGPMKPKYDFNMMTPDPFIIGRWTRW